MLILDIFKKVCQNKQYRFTAEDKFKYIKIVKSKGLKIAILDFTEEFSQIYKKEKSLKNLKHKIMNTHFF